MLSGASKLEPSMSRRSKAKLQPSDAESNSQAFLERGQPPTHVRTTTVKAPKICTAAHLRGS